MSFKTALLDPPDRVSIGLPQ